MSKMTIEELRSELPMAQEVAYFQTGTYGPTLDSALVAVRETMEREAHHGPATPAERQVHVEKEVAARRDLAHMLNVKDDELGITTQYLRQRSSEGLKLLRMN